MKLYLILQSIQLTVKGRREASQIKISKTTRIAQSFLRHKSQKLSFRITYWVTVAANCGALYWLVTPKGSMWLENVLKHIKFG